jgi:hypothetical protein
LSKDTTALETSGKLDILDTISKIKGEEENSKRPRSGLPLKQQKSMQPKSGFTFFNSKKEETVKDEE